MKRLLTSFYRCINITQKCRYSLNNELEVTLPETALPSKEFLEKIVGKKKDKMARIFTEVEVILKLLN